MDLKLKAVGRNLIIRKIVQETMSAGGIDLGGAKQDENITGIVMATPRYSYHPDGKINVNPEIEEGDTVVLMRGKVGCTLPASHIPSAYSKDNKELWVAVPEDMVLYKVEAANARN